MKIDDAKSWFAENIEYCSDDLCRETQSIDGVVIMSANDEFVCSLFHDWPSPKYELFSALFSDLQRQIRNAYPDA